MNHAAAPAPLRTIVLDYLWPLWDKKNQALHDKVVSSVVLKV